jgi:hypothetical protein
MTGCVLDSSGSGWELKKCCCEKGNEALFAKKLENFLTSRGPVGFREIQCSVTFGLQ